MIATALSALMLATLAAGTLVAVWHSRRWRAGAPAKVDILGGVLALPRRYLVDVHHVVARKPFNSLLHALTAGGFLASLPLIVLAALPPLRGWVLWALLFAALGAMLVGTLMVGWRRGVKRPPELSGGGFSRLPFALLAYAVAVLIVAGDQLAGNHLSAPLAFMLLLIGALGAADLILGVGRGPLKHALHGTLHLIAHPRPARFHDGNGRDSGARAFDLGAEKLGVEYPVDFAWNSLLGFEACVQCGRCETVCPAYAAEQPLNPKKLIQDMVAALDETASDRFYAGHHHPGRTAGAAHGGRLLPLVGEHAMIHPDTLWACTTCRACVEACPMMIEHVDAVIDLRRFETLERGLTPGKAAGVLEELRAADNPGGRPAARRIEWAADLALPLIADRRECDLLFWLGDAAFEPRGQRSLRALVRLMRKAGVDFAVLGADELDCGDIARRLGDEATFQELARRNIALLSRYRFNRIVTADPHVLHVLRNEYPAFGGHYTVVHHTALLLELVESGRLVPRAAAGNTVTYHDPCYLGRYNGEIEAPRRLLDTLGLARIEMERSGMRSSCCGGGGGAPLTDVAGKRRIPDMRMDHARATGAERVAVACPNCTVMLEGVVGPRPAVVEIAELVLEAVS
jgi:dimethylglycine catabolism B